MNSLIRLVKNLNHHYGFHEVQTPLLYNFDLWKKSGHDDFYSENIFRVAHSPSHHANASIDPSATSTRESAEDQTVSSLCEASAATPTSSVSEIASPPPSMQGAGYLGIKPMNCPAHCQIYLHLVHACTQLPLRLYDFSPLHRNEPSGK